MCVCVTIAERSAILLVLVIKLTNQGDETGGFEEGGIIDGEIGKGHIVEGGYERLFIV